MFDKNSLLNLLPDLKGSPLSIVLFLALQGNRTVTMNELAAGTGFSDKSLKAGLKKLSDQQIVTSPRFNRYQLIGKNLQLPLYWDEMIEPLQESGETPKNSGDIPELKQKVKELEQRIFALENRRNSESGETPEKFGETPKIEVLPAYTDFGETPGNFGDSPKKTGETPKNNQDPIKELINIYETKEVSKYVDIDTYLLMSNSNTNLLPESGETPKKSGEIPELFATAWKAAMQQMEGQMGKGSYMDILHGADPAGYEDGHYTILMENQFKRDWAEARLTQTLEKILSGILGVNVTVSFAVDQQEAINSQQLTTSDPYEAPSLELLPGSGELTEICNDYLLEPTGIEYSNEQLQELISMDPDPAVLRFVLPIATRFENAKTWCGKDLQSAKRILLKKFGIVNGMAAEIVHNDAATLEMINEICTELCPENKNAVGSRIRQMTSDGKIPEL